MVQIREMMPGDVEAASEIEREAFSMPWQAKDFLEMVQADYAHYYVAVEDGRVIGCCGLRDMAGEGEITNVVVAKNARRKGTGLRLMEHMLEKAGEMGIKACTLEVRVSNRAAIGLYEKLGFAGEGIRPGFYEKPVEDALIMWKR
ncbi:ribosomal-protein-alanine acetyltransferase [Lachnospiraceae bacterium]|nr:ribosomal-protein-alanine acetyltransferase [Lachnospiraceae bacterium]